MTRHHGTGRTAATLIASGALAAAFWSVPVGTLTAQAVEPADALVAEQGRDVVIRGGWLFDGVADDRVPNRGILVRGGTFIAVNEDVDDGDAHVIRLEDDQTIVPGMFDLHAHSRLVLSYSSETAVGDELVQDDARFIPLLRLANGITSIFPAGSVTPERMIDGARHVNSGRWVGPRIFTSGPYFGNSRNVCTEVRTYRDDCEFWPDDITEEEIRDRVDYWASRGVRGLKVKQASPAELGIIVDQAHMHGLTVTGHLHNYEGRGTDVGIREAIGMGIDRIEHSFVDQELILQGEAAPGTLSFEKWIRLFVDHDVHFNGTNWLYGRSLIVEDPSMEAAIVDDVDEDRFLTSYARELRAERSRAGDESEDRRTDQEREWDRINGRVGYTAVHENKLAGFERLIELGGGHLVTTGTDNWSGFRIHNELVALEHVGMPLHMVLKAASVNGAQALGVGDMLGTIEPGKLADLYVVEGNPLADISATRNGRLVMKGGRVYAVDQLLRSAEGKVGPTGPR